MNDTAYIVTQSIIQSVSEFLPISSSGHLLIAKHIFGITPSGLLLDMVLHSASVLVMVIFVLRYENTWKWDRKFLRHLMVMTATTTAVTGVIGLALSRYVFAFSDLHALAYNYLFMALVLFSTRAIRKLPWYGRGLLNMRIQDAVFVGVIQGIAVFPGISRSGMTIVALLILGFRHLDTFFYAFLVAIPTILLATAYVVFKEYATATYPAFPMLVLGFGVTVICSYPMLLFLKHILARERLYLFGIYCLGLAGGLLLMVR